MLTKLNDPLKQIYSPGLCRGQIIQSLRDIGHSLGHTDLERTELDARISNIALNIIGSDYIEVIKELFSRIGSGISMLGYDERGRVGEAVGNEVISLMREYKDHPGVQKTALTAILNSGNRTKDLESVRMVGKSIGNSREGKRNLKEIMTASETMTKVSGVSSLDNITMRVVAETLHLCGDSEKLKRMCSAMYTISLAGGDVEGQLKKFCAGEILIWSKKYGRRTEGRKIIEAYKIKGTENSKIFLGKRFSPPWMMESRA